MIITEIIGSIAALLSTISALPQAIKTVKTQQARDISLWMYILLICGILLWIAYGIMIVSWPLIIGNTVTFFLAATILYVKIRKG